MANANITQNKQSICYTFFEDLFEQIFLRKIQMFGYENLNNHINTNNIKEKSFNELNDEQKEYVFNSLIDIQENNRIFRSLTNEYYGCVCKSGPTLAWPGPGPGLRPLARWPKSGPDYSNLF